MTFDDLKLFETSYHHLNIQMLSALGICAYHKPKPLYLRNFIVNLFFLMASLQQIFELYRSDFNLESIIFFLHYMVPTFTICVCYNIIIYHYSLTRDLYDCIKFDIISIKDEREKAMYRKHYARNKMNTRLISVLLYGSYISIVSPSFVCAILLFCGRIDSTKIILPFSKITATETKMYYYEMLLLYSIVPFVIIMVTATIYVSYVVIIQHACLLLSLVILKISMPLVDDPYDNRFLDVDASNVAYDWIVDIAKSYVKAVKFVKIINAITERVYLVQVTGGVLVLALSFVYLSDMYFSKVKNLVDIVICTMYAVTAMFVAYVNCYLGQTVIDKSVAISNELRQIPFYKFSIKAQKLLPLVILTCAKPCALAIGGIFESSNEFFSGLVQTSVSYAMVCHAMR